jgi:hypothetical protein
MGGIEVWRYRKSPPLISTFYARSVGSSVASAGRFRTGSAGGSRDPIADSVLAIDT